MLQKLMQFSLDNRLVVVVAAMALVLGGTFTALRLPVDVFPDLTAPTVTILTEAHGMAPEEVEALVTFPIETAVNGASGVRRVRSNSIQGLSTIWVEFDWGTDIYRARQIISEKLQGLPAALPQEVDQPLMAPVTSIMGEIMLVGLTAKTTSEMSLRTLADFTLRRRLLAVPGVAKVVVYGGEVKQYQVQIDPFRLQTLGVTLETVYQALRASNVNASGGYIIDAGQEYLLRGIGRPATFRELDKTVITYRNGVSILLSDVAELVVGPASKLGTASINSEPGVMLVISKQPDANTLDLTERIDAVLASIGPSLPPDVIVHNQIFRQADFISLAIANVVRALQEGALLVVLILTLFLMNVRTTIISVVALPLSLLATILVMAAIGLTINTMTLGGLAIAIGVLVDDAIIYVENVYRRVRLNASLPPEEQSNFDEVVAKASAEIRSPIAMATFIVIIVFLPLFFLSGVEGRMLRPLGLAYVIAVLSSLIVAVTVTPSLSSLLLRRIRLKDHRDTWMVRKLKGLYEPILHWALKHSRPVLLATVGLMGLVVVTLPFLGRSFMPEFNEGTLNISVATVPGTSLEQSDIIGAMVEDILLSHPAITSTARRTGRTELDEHSMGSHAHELEAQLNLDDFDKQEVLTDLRNSLTLVPGTVITIGQPISHRIDHMLSGTRANIAVKIFGTDLYELRQVAEEAKKQMEDIEGLVDLSVDQQTEVPQIVVRANRDKMALYGLTVGGLDKHIDMAFLGLTATQILEKESRHDLVVRYALQYRNNIEAIRGSLISTPSGKTVPLHWVTDISLSKGPNYISRENVQRKIVVQANVSGRDLTSVVEDIKAALGAGLSLPQGYYIEYGGQFESAQSATRTVLALSLVSILAILLILFLEFGSIRQAFVIMVNIPLALIGGIVMVIFTGGTITIASLVGFITLFGIAVRNGIMLVSHYNLLLSEGKTVKDAIVQGSLERLNPIMMTAMTTGLALLPLALAGDQPGNEIQSPMSIVILGGLITATAMNMIVLPLLFHRWGVNKA